MATTNLIEIIEGTKGTINCTITGLQTLTGYTSTLSVFNPEADDPDTALFEVTGSHTGLIATFVTTASQNDLDANDYEYEVLVANDTDANEKYIVRQDIYRIVKSRKL